MTLEQLRIFIAVAEREHLTQAALALHLTPSAVSSAVRTLEDRYSVALFHRTGRRIELTETGRAFLTEAKATVTRAKEAELFLAEVGDLRRGSLSLHASQTIASYWLPPVLMQLHSKHPGLELRVTAANTELVAAAVIDGAAEIGLVEGAIDSVLLSQQVVARDRLVIVARPDHPLAQRHDIERDDLLAARWVLREAGSGTRSVLTSALDAKPGELTVELALPSNEAVRAAVRTGPFLGALSELIVQPDIDAGRLVKLDFTLPEREFLLLRHRERHRSKASLAFEEMAKVQAR
ncbi:LysR family transcriptional regulator [Rhizobium sp. ARZ01]|nr:LysR substrate-binding domain-containing protein [Rhizobium sp. ARZ01]MBD9374664.1 LysR family transcriptional regulator [Rhizobium sp. ARZ01]